MGKASGHIHNAGGSTCPEHLEAGAWQISREEEGKWSWVSDPDLQVTCVTEVTEAGKHKPPPYALPYRRPKQGEHIINK